MNNLAHLNATNFAVTVGAATANFLLSDSDTKVLQNPSIRATDGQKADLKIGERIPVATGSYQTGAATAVVSSLVNTQFTYLDVGVEIEITPIVHYDRDVTLKIKLVSSQEQGSTNIGGITEPIISQRTADQVVRLKEGEVNILGGFLQKQDLTSIGGTPGLGELPILKWIFSSTQHEVQDDEIIFMLTPHVVRATEISPLNLQEIDTGTGTNVELRRISAPGNRANGQAGETDGLPPGLQPHPACHPPPAANGTPGPARPGPATPGAATAGPATRFCDPATRSATRYPKGWQHVQGRSQPKWWAGYLLGTDAVALRQQQGSIDQRRYRRLIWVTMARPLRWFIATMGSAMSSFRRRVHPASPG